MGSWRDMASFLLEHGGRTLLGSGLGAALGLAVGLVLVCVGFWWLFVRGRPRSSTSQLLSALVWLSWLAALPAALALGGASLGAAGAVADAVQDADLVESSVELALAGAAAALEGTAGEPGEADWREAALALIEGEERFPLSEVPAQLELLQRSAEQWTARQTERLTPGGEVGAGDTPPGGAAFLARLLLRRLGRLPMEAVSARWLAPVISELERGAVDEAGEIDGRQLALAVVRVHVEGPLARAARNTLVLQAVALLVFALALVVLPLPVLAWLERRGARVAASVGVGTQ